MSLRGISLDSSGKPGRIFPLGQFARIGCMRWPLVTLALVGVIYSPAHAREPVRARHAMVGAQEPLATEVGVQVLKDGGNAVDAAIAVGFALAVTHPYAGNLGGGGFMLIRFADGRSTFLDFRERAPEKASRNMYVDVSGKPTRESLDGWKSAGVPGTVRGFELAHRKYGSRKWAGLIEPAIALAEHGFPASYALAESLKSSRNLA